MNTTSASPADLSAAVPDPRGRRTVDAPTRIVHALLIVSFVGAYLTAESERLRLVHITLGYTLAAAVAFRVVWGLLGPRTARLSQWGRRLMAGPSVLRTVRAQGVLGALQPLQNLGHAVLVVGLLVLAALTPLSGYVMYEELAGEWTEELHELLGNLMLLAVLGHVALIVVMSVLRQRNLILPMVTGRAPGAGPDRVQRNHGWLALALLVSALGFWAWQWQQAPVDGVTGTDVTRLEGGDNEGRGSHAHREGGDHDHGDDDEDDDD